MQKLTGQSAIHAICRVVLKVNFNFRFVSYFDAHRRAASVQLMIKNYGPEITSRDLNSRLKLTRRIKLEITFTRNNPPKTRNNSLNLLRTDPVGPGNPPWGDPETPGNHTKRYENVDLGRFEWILVQFYSTLVESGDYP